MNHPATGLCWCWLLLAATAAVAAAEPADHLLAQLNADDYAQRQSASAALLADESLTTDAITAMFAAATTAEQRHRLLGIAQHHLLRQHRLAHFPVDDPQGSIGVQIEGVEKDQLPALNRPAIRVTNTLPGFPAHGVLLAGDLILMVNDRAFRPANAEAAIQPLMAQVIEAISAQGAGHAIKLTVRRGERMLAITLPVASRSALATMYDTSNRRCHLAPPLEVLWQERLDELQALAPTPTNLLQPAAAAHSTRD